MIMKQTQPTLRNSSRRDPASSEPDPSKLSATLRELALRAHSLVRTTDRSSSETGPGADNQELSEVHAQIVQLQRNLRAHHLHGLDTYVSALRERVEEHLA
jgi:hypothetical protein